MQDHTTQALDIARELIRAGIPVFIAPPATGSVTGFALPVAWQQTECDLSVVDAWAPGMCMAAVMGHGLDLVDVDPRNGGVASLEQMNGAVPDQLGMAATPSNGVHLFIPPLDAASRNNILPGIDVKTGRADGQGRGFAFIAPTVRVSKVSGEPVAYRWVLPPAIERIGKTHPSTDALAALLRSARSVFTPPVFGEGPMAEFWRGREPQSSAAATAAITDKLAAVTGWTPTSGRGFREVLMAAALTLGGYIGAGFLDEEQAREQLRDAAGSVWGSPDENDELWISQGVGDGRARPFRVLSVAEELQHAAASTVGGTPAAAVWPVYAAIGLQPFEPDGGTHQDHAESMARRLWPALRWASDAGGYVVNRGERWVQRPPGHLADWAVSTLARLMPHGVAPEAGLQKADWTAEHWQHHRRSQWMSTPGAAPISRKYQSIIVEKGHIASLDVAELDTDPDVLWAGGQPWDLRASADGLSVAQRAVGLPHLHTAAVVPVLAPTPAWDAFTAAIWPDAELRRWALRVLSVAVTGYPDAALPILYGPGGTGKSSIIALIMRALGTYGLAANPKLLSDHTAHDSIVYALKGARLAFIDEGPRSGYASTERLKQLTGGGALTGNAMRHDPVTFDPTHTLVLTSNEEPTLTDQALRRRLRAIPCEGDVEAVARTRRAITRDVWADEQPGVLGMLMQHAAGWLADPDSAGSAAAPAWVQQDTEDMAQAQSPVRHWVTDRTIPADPGTPSRELYVAFVAWYSGQPIYRTAPPSETRFGRELTEAGYPWIKRPGGTRYRLLAVTGGGFLGQPTLNNSVGGLNPPSGRVENANPPMDITAGQTPKKENIWEGWEGLLSTSEISKYPPQKVPLPPLHTADIGNDLETLPRNALGTTPDLGKQGLGGLDSDPPTTLPVPHYETARKKSGNVSIDRKLVTERNRNLKRAAAIESAAGPTVELPALVDRTGAILTVTLTEAQALIGSAAGDLTVDVETTGYPLGHADYALRLVQLGTADWCLVLDPDDTDSREFIRDALSSAHTLRAYSATADLGPLAAAGLGDHGVMWAKMVDVAPLAILAQPTGGQSDADSGLKTTAARYLADPTAPAAERAKDALFTAGKWLKQVKIDTPVERSGWACAPKDSATFVRYGASDVLDTAQLAHTLPDPGAVVFGRERAIGAAVAPVSYRGLRLDVERVERLAGEHTERRGELAAQLTAAGIATPSSPIQVARWLTEAGVTLPTTDKGNPSVDAESIGHLVGISGPIGDAARVYAEYVKIGKRLSAFLTPWHVMATRGDGRLRPTIYTLGAEKTGRMSAVRPNMQQVPRVGGYRECIIADPGCVLIGADFSQVEIRVAAILSGDEQLKAMLREGLKVHNLITEQVFGAGYTDEQRNGVKRGVFGWLYGGGIPTLARQLDGKESSAHAMVATLSAIAPRLVAWRNEVVYAVKSGQLTKYQTYSGRIIHIGQAHSAPNYLVQGSARELLGDALIRFSDTQYRGNIILPVHDEIITQVPENEAEEGTRILVECMEQEMQGVRIIAEPATPSVCWPVH